MYIKLKNDVYKLETCVITNGAFIIEKLQNLKLTLSGEGTKLLSDSTLLDGISLPSRGTRDYQLLKQLAVTVDTTSLSTGLYSCSVELQNEVKGNPYATVNNALNVTNAATSMYPSQFTLEKRTLSGSIGQYVTDSFNTDVQSWKQGVTVNIVAGNGLDAPHFRGFIFNLAHCTFTNRLSIEDVYTQAYDWKMNDNVADLGTKITLN